MEERRHDQQPVVLQHSETLPQRDVWGFHDVKGVGTEHSVEMTVRGVDVVRGHHASLHVVRQDCLEPLAQLVAADPSPSLQTLLDGLDFRAVTEVEWRGWGEDGRSWRSIDTPDELAALQDGR